MIAEPVIGASGVAIPAPAGCCEEVHDLLRVEWPRVSDALLQRANKALLNAKRRTRKSHPPSGETQADA